MFRSRRRPLDAIRDNALEIACAFGRCMAVERSFAGALTNRTALVRIEIEGIQRVVGARRDQDLLTRLEELVEPFPPVADDRGATRGRFEQSAGWAIAHFRHRSARHIERQRRRAIERWMLRWREMPHVMDVWLPGKPLRILR